MTPEKEIAEKGLDVSEMNKLLTKKVEGLTLYLIEIKSKNEKIMQSQQRQINELKMQLKKNLKKA